MIAPRRPLPSSTSCLVILAIALLIGVVSGLFAAGDTVLPGDVGIATTIQHASGPVPEILARIGNTAGTTAWAAIALALILVAAAMVRAWAEAMFLATLLVLRLLGTQLKPIFGSPRPTDDLVTILGSHDGFGYPSGHSLTGATLCLGLAVLAWRLIPSRRLAIVAVALLIGLMLVIGWARVWVGAHWPSDVIGGFSFGLAFVAIGVIVMERVARTR